MSMKNPVTPAGIEPATFRFVAQHLNHCAIAVPCPYWTLFYLCLSQVCHILCGDNDICTLWGFYGAMYGSSLRTLRDNISGLSSRPKQSKKNGYLPREDGTDGFFRHFGADLPYFAA